MLLALAPPGERARMLLQCADVLEYHADEMAELVSRENGKPIIDARHPPGAAWASRLRGHQGNARRREDSRGRVRRRDRRCPRFAGPRQLSSWAGLTPRHHESDTTVRRGHITKQGSTLVRWAAVEAVARQRGPTKIMTDLRRIAERRGRSMRGSPRRARFSRSSTTGCAMGTSAACPNGPWRRREATGDLSTARAREVSGPRAPWRGRTFD
jgi:hypothetical protein